MIDYVVLCRGDQETGNADGNFPQFGNVHAQEENKKICNGSQSAGYGKLDKLPNGIAAAGILFDLPNVHKGFKKYFF
jgi:hypothetical protein